MWRSLRFAALGVGLLACTLPFGAHTFDITDVAMQLETGSFRIDITVDVDALALGVSPTTESAQLAAELEALDATELAAAIERARNTLLRRTRIRIDGEKSLPEISFPPAPKGIASEQTLPTVLGLTARLTGSIPQDARELRFGLSRSFGASSLTIKRDGNVTTELLGVAEDFTVALDQPTRVSGAAATLARYVRLGFVHIIPAGADHILFVLGLFLLGRGLRPLLVQISAFTVAHTLTLGIAAAGWLRVPGAWVEPLIALSIAWVAIENIAGGKLTARRTAIVFGFGLLHGLGFAGVLGDVGLPAKQLLPALAGFNLGVEFGQLGVVALAWLLLHRIAERAWYRSRVLVPGSLAIAATGLFWTIERIFFP